VEERRAHIRLRTLKGARIAINDHRSTFQCTVRNLSTGGALLRVASVVGIPDSFDLVMDDGREFACTAVWRSATEIGVSFSPAQ